MDLTAVSLFAGAGGMDIGFKNAGIKVLAANELDASACQTYKENHPETLLFEGDIETWIDLLDDFKGVDLVFGGPPCQGFSVAGKMDPDDPRSKLVFSFVDAVERLKPQAFIMENVKALGKLDKFKDVRAKLSNRFSMLGYETECIILNAKEFGVPQSRERTFFIGINKRRGKFNPSVFQKYNQTPMTLRQAISHLGPAGSKNNLKVCNAKITIASKPIMRRSPYAGMMFNGQGRPLNPDGWSSTLPASMGGNRTPIIDEKHMYENAIGWIEKYHKHLIDGGRPYGTNDAPEYLRRLTVDEAIILQTFPKDYIFNGSQSKVFSQIGNAVPCKLAEVVALAVKDLLEQS